VYGEDITQLQLAAARAWPAPICEPLGEWWLRSAEGFTGRGNSALPLGDPGLTLPEAIDHVEHFYRGLGYRPAIEIPLPLRSDVRDVVRARGWGVQTAVRVQSIALDRLIAATPGGDDFDLLDEPSDEHVAMIRSLRGPLPPAAMHLLTGVRPITFAEFRRAGTLVCRARGSITDGWLGLIGIETGTAWRGHGLASAAIGRLARWAVELGARAAFLQVDTSNPTALRLYERLGFRTHHTYERYAPPAA
jgi:ribosomal protein S18 acetylase RimI-like enzyme